MRFPEHHQFEWTGYDTYYEDVMPKIETILQHALDDPDEHYLIAINEAVCNAARYSVAGPEQAKIQILMMLNDGDIKTIVQSETRPFNVMHFRHSLKQLADNPDTASMEWGMYTAESAKSRGYWIMLMACDYIAIDVTGKRVTLCAKRPFRPWHIRKQIQNLVPRLYLEKNGVIF